MRIRVGGAWQAYAALLLLLAACTGGREETQAPPSSFYLPPTPYYSTAPSRQGTPAQAKRASPPEQSPLTPACNSNLTFVQDLSIPDGAQVAPEERLDKVWEVENSGTCNWDERFRVRLVAGPELGAPPESALFPARSGARAALRMRFTAPAEPGAYRSAWQAVDPQGKLFGDLFFIEFEVVAATGPIPTE
ncbi:MAG: NBR1-Ig-like domain-containing protein [Anaerolineales bacterium]|nr:NBR1-Ig-like domain-containing protein [Anaerolineales bacterium]